MELYYCDAARDYIDDNIDLQRKFREAVASLAKNPFAEETRFPLFLFYQKGPNNGKKEIVRLKNVDATLVYIFREHILTEQEQDLLRYHSIVATIGEGPHILNRDNDLIQLFYFFAPDRRLINTMKSLEDKGRLDIIAAVCAKHMIGEDIINSISAPKQNQLSLFELEVET